MKVTRRTFLGGTAAAVIVASTRATGRVFGANNRIGIACVGLNGRGQDHIEAFTKSPRAQVVALCDVDRRVLDRRARGATLRQRAKPTKYEDIRDLLQDPAVDAVTLATPNHWHALGAVWAVQAGKHVYVEKPLSHNPWEGRQLVEAARKHGRIVQHGTQRRSEPAWLNTIQHLRDGVIGNVYMARALCFKSRGPIGFKPPEPPPDRLNWDLWQGPALERAYCDNYVPYNWHWFWAYGNGDIGNQAVHQIDVALWGLNRGLPVTITSTGGRYTYDDQGETPNTQSATFTYADGTMLVVDVRGRFTNAEENTRIGNLFYGSEGYFAEGDKARHEKDQYAFFNRKGHRIRVKEREFDTLGCYENFLRAVASGNEKDNPAPAAAGHLAALHVHLANAAYRLKRTLRIDPATEQAIGDDEANALLRPPLSRRLRGVRYLLGPYPRSESKDPTWSG